MLLSIAGDLESVRRRTLHLIVDLSDADLERRLHPLLGPLVWDLGHIAAYEDLWLVHRLRRAAAAARGPLPDDGARTRLPNEL